MERRLTSYDLSIGGEVIAYTLTRRCRAEGLADRERREMGWDDEDERYMNHLDDIYMGRVIELYAGTTFVRYKEKVGDETPMDLTPEERVRVGGRKR